MNCFYFRCWEHHLTFAYWSQVFYISAILSSSKIQVSDGKSWYLAAPDNTCGSNAMHLHKNWLADVRVPRTQEVDVGGGGIRQRGRQGSSCRFLTTDLTLKGMREMPGMGKLGSHLSAILSVLLTSPSSSGGRREKCWGEGGICSSKTWHGILVADPAGVVIRTKCHRLGLPLWHTYALPRLTWAL